MSSIESLLNESMNAWMLGGGKEADIVLSSRVRLARNLEGIPFPNRASEEDLAVVAREIAGSMEDLKKATQHEYIFADMEELSPLDRYVLVEKHIISPQHVQEVQHRALLAAEDASVSIMINEEDHLRIQCMAAGLELREALDLANRVDDSLEAKHSFGFNEQMGYLTACPTNLGTGLRASVMLHLPVLVLTRQINRVIGAATQIGLAVRGFYGEGTEAVGNVFQISNQLTLGYTENEIIENLNSVVRQIVEQERKARRLLLAESKDTLSDRIWRSFGILRYARSISGQEALTMLSEVRLGIDMGIVTDVPENIFNELLVTTRPNFLQKLAMNRGLHSEQRDQLRAKIIRKRLREVDKYV